MKMDIFDLKGKSVGQIELDKSVFGAETKMSLIAQYIRVIKSNQRQGTSSTKTRAEVSGGGKKPWKQKGTGRARHGSTRSPIWVKGGIAHGPRPKSWTLGFSANMKKAAIISILSTKQAKKQITILDKVEIKEPKTKKVLEITKALKMGGKTLFVTNGKNDNLLMSSKNIPTVYVSMAQNLNGFDLMNVKNVLIEKDAVEVLQEKYKK